MEIPHLGSVTRDPEFGWYLSEPIPLPLLDGAECQFVLDGYEEDGQKEDFHQVIANLLALGPEALKAVEQQLFQYYEDAYSEEYLDEDELIEIESPEEVWESIELGDQFIIRRREYGDRGIYASLTCGCDWEEEHGLEIVFKNGQKVNKLGPYDGHLTNADSYDDESLEDVIYVRVGG